MTLSSNSLEAWLAQSVTGSLVIQRAEKRGIDIDAIASTCDIEAAEAIAVELDDFGVNADKLARHVVASMAVLFMHKDNAETMVDSFSDILWKVLGDPAQGGSSPPEIYRRAGFFMHLAFIGFFDPSIPERVLKRGN